jgi:hypothetical protein
MPKGIRKEKVSEKNIKFEALTTEQKITAFSLYSAFKLTGDPKLKEAAERMGFSTQTATKALKDGLRILARGFEGDRTSNKVTSGSKAEGYSPEAIKRNGKALFALVAEKDSVGTTAPTRSGEAKGDLDSEESADPDEEPDPVSVKELEPESEEVWLEAMDDLVAKAQKCKKDDYRELLDLREELDRLVHQADVGQIGLDRVDLVTQYAEIRKLDRLKVGNYFGFRKSRVGNFFDEKSLNDFNISKKAGTIELSAEQIAWKEENQANRHKDNLS